MHKTGMLALAFLAFPTWAGADTARCAVSHFVRVGGTEIRSTSISLRNFDPTHAATIERITIYDFFGRKVHESVAPAHPINTDIPGGVDITVVPPNANYYLRTNHIWGNNSIPDLGDGFDGNARGFNMTAVVEFSKPGNPKLFAVGTNTRARDRFANPPPGPVFEGAERAFSTGACS